MKITYLCTLINLMIRLFLLACCLFTFFGLPAQKINERFQVNIKKSTGPIKVDGVLDENAWLESAAVSDFVMCNPYDSLCAQVRTDVKIAYDDKYIYISAECFLKEPGAYVVESMKRDFAFGVNDNFLVFIDTFEDKTTGFAFGSNAAGAQWDGQMSEGAKVNLNWDNKWESATTYKTDSWIFEAAIPFKSIRYKDNVTRWGINFSRYDLKAKEKSAWAPVPRQFPTASLAYAGVLVWDTPPPAPKKNISVIPYTLSGITANYRSGKPTAFRQQFGGDVKVAINSGLNLDMTINPDFSQVDVDRQQTNLDRFELFYPERRQFFIENSDLFDGFGTENIRPFFSRRIGLTINPKNGNYEQTPITYGARLSGKLNKDWRIGVLNAQAESIFSNADTSWVPNQNFSMIAFQRKLFARSNFGVYIVNKQSFIDKSTISDTAFSKIRPFQSFNRDVGFEYNLASANNFWTGSVFYAKTLSPLEKPRDFSQAASLAYGDNNWVFAIKEQWVGENYNPESGFVPRVNYFQISTEGAKIFYPKNKSINLFYSSLKLMSLNLWNNQGDYTDNTSYVAYEGVMKDRSTFGVYLSYDFVKLQDDFDATRMRQPKLLKGTEHDWYAINARYFSSPIKLFTYAVTSRFGGYFGDGWRTGITADLGYRFQPFGSISMAIDYNDIQNVHLPATENVAAKKLSSQFWIVRPKIDITFTNKLFLATFFQLNQQNDFMNLYVRLQWRYKPASDLFVVYSDNFSPTNFQIRDRTIVLKLNYWLNL
jgi:hypothetical protein